MPPDVPRYWFPAKRYGWGWGLPSTWEGWVVTVAFFALAVGGIIWFPPQHAPIIFIAYMSALSLGLTAICWWKGEPSRWRWGGK